MISQELSKLAPLKSEEGFSLIEILMALLLVGILSAVSIGVIGNSLEDARFDETVNEMRAISDAIVGNKKLREGGSRTSFGYFGDVGALPTTLADLTTKPALVTAYTVSNSARTAHGWNGPYLEAGDSTPLAANDYTTDGFGTAYVYDTAATPPTLTSYGANKVLGGAGLNQDIVISFPTAERLATVEGFVSDGGVPFTGTGTAQINYPNGLGGLSQPTTALVSNGHFSFSNVPFGVRSITISRTTPSASTIGPFIVTVDKPRVVIPGNQLDFNNP